MKYLLKKLVSRSTYFCVTYCIPGSGLGTRDTQNSEIDIVPAVMRLLVYWERYSGKFYRRDK